VPASRCGPKRERASDRNADDPGQRQAATHGRLANEQHDRGDDRSRRQHTVFERTETEHTGTSLPCAQPDSLQSLVVEREAATLQEDTEPGRNQRRHLRPVEGTSPVGADDLAVGDRVAEVSDHLRCQRSAEPRPARMQQQMAHTGETRRPRNSHERRHSQQRGQRNQQRDLMAASNRARYPV
jgi:hypothetical protein